MLERDDYGLFAVLPTEVCHFVLAYMDKDTKDAFAKCSRHCYFVSFPARFSGVKLSEVNHRNCLNMFTRGWLAPLRRWVQAVVLDIMDIRYLEKLPPKAAIFPNLRSLSLHINGPQPFEENVYTALFSSLCKLSYYDNLNHLAIGWYGYHLHYYDVESADFQIHNQPSPITFEQWRRKDYERDMELFPQAEQDALGPFISKETIMENAISGENIRLPKHLQTFGLGSGACRTYYFLPLLNCPTVTTLFLDFLPNNLAEAEKPNFPIIFPNIKTINVHHIGVTDRPDILLKHFTNLESLRVSNRCYIHWVDLLASLPVIKHLTVPWPKARLQYIEVDTLNGAIDRKLERGYLRGLETVDFHGSYQIDECEKDIAVTCKISFNSHGFWDLRWEGDVEHTPSESQLADFEVEALQSMPSDSYDDDSSESEPDDGDVSEYEDTGDQRYEHSDDSESEEEGYSGDSEYWDTDDELRTESDEDSEMSDGSDLL